MIFLRGSFKCSMGVPNQGKSIALGLILQSPETKCKIRPSLTTSKEGLKTLNIYEHHNFSSFREKWCNFKFKLIEPSNLTLET